MSLTTSAASAQRGSSERDRRLTAFLLDLAALLALTGVPILCYRHFLFAAGGRAAEWEWLLPIYSGQYLDWLRESLSAWRSWELGAASAGTTALYQYALFAVPASLGLDGPAITKLFLVAFMAGGGYGAYYLCRTIKIGRASSLLAGLAYMLSPLYFDRIVAGHLVSHFTVYPWVVAFFYRSVEDRNLKLVVIAALLTIIADFNIPFLMFTGLTLFLLATLRSGGRAWPVRHASASLALWGVLTVAVNSHWILLQAGLLAEGGLGEIVEQSVGRVPAGFYSPGAWAGLENTLRLTGFHAAFFVGVATDIGGTWWPRIGYFVPMLAFAALLLWRHDWRSHFFGLVALIGILLASASLGPLGSVWVWILENVPYMLVFREPYKLINMAVLGYAVLIALTVEAFLLFLARGQWWRRLPSVMRPRQLGQGLAVVGVAAVIFSWGAPYLTGDGGGHVNNYSYPDAYREVWQWGKDNPEDVRILWLPAPYPSQFEGQTRWGYDPVGFRFSKSSLYQGKSYGPPIVPFVFKMQYEERTQHLAQLLGVANVGYVVFDTNKRSVATDGAWPQRMAPGMAFTNDKLARTLSQQPGLEPEQSWGPITLYRNREALPHIFPVQQVALMAGGLDGLVTLTYSDQENLANTGVVFLSQLSPSEIRSLGQLSSSKFIIQEGYLPELALSLAEGRHSIDPVLYTSVTNPDEGWTPYEWGWYHWQTLTSLKRVAFTLAPASLSMPVSVDGGVYEAFVRAYYSARASALTLSVDGRGIGEAMTAVGDEVGFRWVGLGEIELEAGNHTLRLDSNAGENFVSNIVLVEKGAFRKAQQEAQQLAEGKRVLILSEPSLETPLEASWRKDAKELVIQALTQPQLTPRDLPFGAGLQDDILTLDVTFRHAASKEESLYLYSQIDGLDLRAATVLTLWVGVDSPSRQEIDIKAFLDTDEDGKHDVTLRSRENGDWLATLRGRLPTEVEKLSFNLLEAARTLAPNRPSYRVVGLEIGFAKVGDMTGPRAGNYGFRVKSVQLEGPMAEAAVIPEKEMSPPALEGTGWRLDGEELATLAEKSPYPAPGGPYVSPEGLTYQVRKQEGLAILSFQFTRPANVVESLATLVTAPSVDLTRTPYLSLQAKVDKPQNQEIILRFFLDTNGDGKQDVTVRSYEWPEIANKLSGGLPTRFQRLDVNVLKMAQDSAPGKPSYLLVAFEIEYRKRGNTTGSQGGEYKFSVRDLGLVGSLPKEIRGEPWYSEDVGVSASQGTALVAAAPASPHTVTMDVPQPGEYVLSIRAKADSAGGGLGVRVGSERFQVFPGRDFGWHIAGPIWLSEGLARLSVEPQGTGKVYLDQLSLATRQGEGEKDRDAVVQATSKRLHYTKYEIDVKAEQPFFLVFAEAYDPGWRLRLEDGTTLRNYPAYSFGNLYLVERTGAFEMTLEFDRQRIYTLVQRVCFASVAVLLFLLVLPRVVWNWLWRRCHLFRSH